MIKKFKDKRIRLISQKNAGVSAARNRGIKEAKADLIAFLDADDEWTVSFLEIVLRLRNMYPEAGAYATAYEKSHSYGEKLKPSYKNIPPAPWEGLLSNYFLIASLQEMPISTSAVCIPKSVLTEFGGFQEGVLVWEDSELWGKIAIKYKIAFSHELGSIYHLDSINRSSSKKYPTSEHPFTKIALEKIKNNEVPTEILDDLKEYVAFLEILFAFRNIRGRNYIKAFKVLCTYKERLLRPKMMYGLFTTLRHR